MGGSEPAMDDAPAEEPPPEMDIEMGAEEELELDEEYGGKKGDESKSHRDYMKEDKIVQEVAKRVAKRINEAAKKSDK